MNFSRYTLLTLVFFVLIGIIPQQSRGALCTAVTNGNWEDATTWSTMAKPGCGDSILIPAGRIVTIVHTQEDYSACYPANVIDIYGTLQFVNGFKLRLNCISTITLRTGGIIAISGGGGSNNLIEVCNNVMWRASCGNLAGPLIIPPYDCDQPVPITLVLFTADKRDNACILNWVTVAELNNDYFVVERSADAKSFDAVGRVDGAGNSTASLYYSFTDISPLPHISYYRLKQVDYNGTSNYSDVIGFMMKSNGLESLITTVDYENNNILVTMSNDIGENIAYCFSDALGRIITSGSEKAMDETTSFGLSILGLTHGIYYLTIRTGAGVSSKKIFY